MKQKGKTEKYYTWCKRGCFKNTTRYVI